MQNNKQSLLVNRENYRVPKGQEHKVHCKIAKLDSNGGFIERPRLTSYGEKAFDSYHKSNLELLGYTIEILFHPHGKYSNVRIVDKDAELERMKSELEALKIANAELEKRSAESSASADKDAELAEKDKEIARLRKELDKSMKKKEA